MDVTRESRDRLGRLAAWLEATPAELTGLLVLVTGAVLASVVLWLQAEGRPGALPSEAAHVGAPLDATASGPDGHTGSGRSGSEQDASPAAATSPATVHVTGAVAAPGLVTLPPGARVGDAVAAAGGMIADADPARLNLARPVDDGEHVHLPRIGEDVPPAGAAETSGSGATDSDGRVDINRATVEELETLPGIGPAKAAAIVSHREEHGPFATPGDLRAVSGIGERTFQGLADLVVAR